MRGAGAYAHMCAGDLDGVEETVDELLELTAGDPTLGAGIVIGSPAAWGLMAKSMALRERDRVEEAEALVDEALRIAAEHDDPETESWTRGTQCLLLADRGDTEAALALARHNCELTEQLGDVFSRSTALNALTYVLDRRRASPPRRSRRSSSSDRLYREAMGTGGETEAWRVDPARPRAARTRPHRAGAGGGRVGGRHRAAGGHGLADPCRLSTPSPRRGRRPERPGVEEALDEATEEAESRGHAMSLRKIDGRPRDAPRRRRGARIASRA